MADYGRDLTLDLPFADAVEKVRQAFADQGFGTLTEIDVRAKLQEKLGEDIGPYTILGTCNPNLARRAIAAEPSIGLLLPCNVVVRADGDATLVQALDPEVMVRVPDNADLKPIAEEAGRLIDAAMDALRA